jgi:hypothetical protein
MVRIDVLVSIPGCCSKTYFPGKPSIRVASMLALDLPQLPKKESPFSRLPLTH